MKKCLIFLLFIGYLLSGCNVTRTEETTLTPEKTESFFSTSEPTSSVQVVPTSVPFGHQNETQSANQYTIHCMDVSNIPLSKLSLSGTLIIGYPTTLGEKFHIDFMSGEKSPFFNGNVYGANEFFLSPNGEWIAYVRWDSQDNHSLVIRSVNGGKTYTYPWGFSEWQAIVTLSYWLNNEKLVVWNHSGVIDNVILFDAFTGNKTVMETKFPDIISSNDFWDSAWPSVTIFDPSLEYLVYLSNNDGKYELGNQRMVLWDLKRSKRITEVNKFGYTFVWPIWKSDSSGVVYVKSIEGYNPPENKDEWFFLGKGGKVKQLTDLSSYFHNSRIFSYSLSPDEKFLAFVLQVDKEGERWENKLLILNMITLEIRDYCFSPEQLAPLVWSIDSNNLAFSRRLNDKTSDTVVIDLFAQKAFFIAGNSQPLVWFNSIK